MSDYSPQLLTRRRRSRRRLEEDSIEGTSDIKSSPVNEAASSPPISSLSSDPSPESSEHSPVPPAKGKTTRRAAQRKTDGTKRTPKENVETDVEANEGSVSRTKVKKTKKRQRETEKQVDRGGRNKRTRTTLRENSSNDVWGILEETAKQSSDQSDIDQTERPFQNFVEMLRQEEKEADELSAEKKKRRRRKPRPPSSKSSHSESPSSKSSSSASSHRLSEDEEADREANAWGAILAQVVVSKQISPPLLPSSSLSSPREGVLFEESTVTGREEQDTEIDHEEELREQLELENARHIQNRQKKIKIMAEEHKRLEAQAQRQRAEEKKRTLVNMLRYFHKNTWMWTNPEEQKLTHLPIVRPPSHIRWNSDGTLASEAEQQRATFLHFRRIRRKQETAAKWMEAEGLLLEDRLPDESECRRRMEVAFPEEMRQFDRIFGPTPSEIIEIQRVCENVPAIAKFRQNLRKSLEKSRSTDKTRLQSPAGPPRESDFSGFARMTSPCGVEKKVSDSSDFDRKLSNTLSSAMPEDNDSPEDFIGDMDSTTLIPEDNNSPKDFIGDMDSTTVIPEDNNSPKDFIGDKDSTTVIPEDNNSPKDFIGDKDSTTVIPEDNNSPKEFIGDMDSTTVIPEDNNSPKEFIGDKDSTTVIPEDNNSPEECEADDNSLELEAPEDPGFVTSTSHPSPLLTITSHHSEQVEIIEETTVENKTSQISGSESNLQLSNNAFLNDKKEGRLVSMFRKIEEKNIQRTEDDLIDIWQGLGRHARRRRRNPASDVEEEEYVNRTDTTLSFEGEKNNEEIEEAHLQTNFFLEEEVGGRLKRPRERRKENERETGEISVTKEEREKREVEKRERIERRAIEREERRRELETTGLVEGEATLSDDEVENMKNPQIIESSDEEGGYDDEDLVEGLLASETEEKAAADVGWTKDAHDLHLFRMAEKEDAVYKDMFTLQGVQERHARRKHTTFEDENGALVETRRQRERREHIEEQYEDWRSDEDSLLSSFYDSDEEHESNADAPKEASKENLPYNFNPERKQPDSTADSIFKKGFFAPLQPVSTNPPLVTSTSMTSGPLTALSSRGVDLTHLTLPPQPERGKNSFFTFSSSKEKDDLLWSSMKSTSIFTSTSKGRTTSTTRRKAQPIAIPEGQFMLRLKQLEADFCGRKDEQA